MPPPEKMEGLGPRTSKDPGKASNASADMPNICLRMHGNKTLAIFSCTFSEEDPSLHDGRVCTLDQGACFNFSRPELVEKCPTLQAHVRGEPVGQTPDLDYPGPKHVVRQGPRGEFVTGMPPEYLRGQVKKGAAEQ